ncbi:hypothetical protein HDU82_005469 [Entophlyctis luteolus]|nr:hypothetical protein HDU82_005469 [Entophlyctis luteolus]
MSYVDTTPLSWQLPIALQALFSGVVLVGCFFIPESPRWLLDKGRDEEVRRFLVHYHGNEIEDHPIVEFTLNEMREALEDARRQNTASYMAFFTSIPMLYRTGLLIAVAFFSQYAGSWFASGFNVIVNSQFGFSSPQQQLGLSIVTSILNFVAAQIGASYVERVGRRPMLIYGSMSYVVCWIVILICLQIFNNDSSQTAVGVFGWIVVQVFSMIYSFTWTPLNALYPVEILPYSARAKGMAFCQLLINAASVIQNWVLIYGVNSYGWKWDAFYCVFNVFAGFIIYTHFVETKGYTLEKIEDIFNDPNPVKKSLSEIRQVVSADTHVPRTKQYQYDPSTTLYIKYQSEFADAPLRIIFTKPVAAPVLPLQCGESLVACTCGDGDPRAPPNPAAADGAWVQECPVGMLEKTQSHVMLEGTVELAFEPKLRDVGEVAPTLQVTFVGREHIDLAATANVLQAAAAKAPSGPVRTSTFLTLTQRIPWIPRTSPDTVAYKFCIPVPLNIPPSAAPEQGAIDYRLEARFLLPEDGLYDEIVTQKRVEVFRVHASENMIAGPLVQSVPIWHQQPDGTTPSKQPETVFSVDIQAPQCAFLDNGKLRLRVKVTSAQLSALNKAKSVVAAIEERTRYVWVGQNAQGKAVRKIKTEARDIGIGVLADLAKIHSSEYFDMEIKFGNGLGDNGNVRVIVNPTFSGGQIFVSHAIVVRVLYGDSEVDANAKASGMREFFTRMTVNLGAAPLLNHEAAFEVPIILRTGLVN